MRLATRPRGLNSHHRLGQFRKRGWYLVHPSLTLRVLMCLGGREPAHGVVFYFRGDQMALKPGL